MQSARPIRARPPTASDSTSHAPSATQIGAVVARNVAFATVVPRIAKCQKNRSPVNSSPASSIARSSRGHAAERFSIRIHTQRNGSARNTRQNALAYGPTSAHRTNSTEAPIAIAPSTSAVDRECNAASFGRGGDGRHR